MNEAMRHLCIAITSLPLGVTSEAENAYHQLTTDPRPRFTKNLKSDRNRKHIITGVKMCLTKIIIL